MKNVLIWGISTYYEKHFNLIMSEQYKGNINILAYISKDKRYQSEQDGKPVIYPKDIVNFNYDYIIIASTYFKEIRKTAIDLGISEDVLIPIKVFSIPMFDFNKYIDIKERKISIIADACYGAHLYHSLGLKFTSPFINMRIYPNDYLKLLYNLEYYLSLPFEMENDNIIADLKKTEEECYSSLMGYPIARLHDTKLHLFHVESFEIGKELWERRNARFNKNDILVLMIIENDNIAEAFDNLPFKNKIGFYYKDTPYESIINLNEWADSKIRFNNDYMFRKYAPDMFSLDEYRNQNFNIFDLFDGKINLRKTFICKG